MYPYVIDDPIEIADSCTIGFPEGKRWLFFATPKQLASNGELIDGSDVRFHLGDRHMIVVGKASPAIIDAVLNALYLDGELHGRTLPLASN
jgi:hypothetical protein